MKFFYDLKICFSISNIFFFFFSFFCNSPSIFFVEGLSHNEWLGGEYVLQIDPMEGNSQDLYRLTEKKHSLLLHTPPTRNETGRKV